MITGHDGNELAGGMPLWKIYPTRAFKRFDKASIEVNEAILEKDLEFSPTRTNCV